MSHSMSRSERESFLSEPHVGVLSVSGRGGRPLAVPVWYTFVPGGAVSVITGLRSTKGLLIEAANRFGICAQTEVAPYKYVSVEGPVIAKENPVSPTERREMAHRYLGEKFGDLYFESTEPDASDSAHSASNATTRLQAAQLSKK
jgi:Pyridoxamine 5'-phosphate oxidase